MKKIFLTLSGSLLISLCALQAQQQNDTTGTASESRQRQSDQYGQPRQQSDRSQQQNDQAWQQESDKNVNRNAYANEGMVIIEKHEIPASLKQTLKEEKYEGWENGTIYHNTNTGEYVIAPRAYRFDQSGKEIEMDNTTGYGDSQNRQGRYSNDPSQNAYPNRTRESERSTQQQAKDEMGEVPTSASKDQEQGNQQSDNDASQQSSRSYRSDQDNQQDRSDANPQRQPGQDPQSQYRSENMIEIQAEQIPASLRRTLRESQYQGWEKNGTLYQDRSTQEYVLEMNQTDNASQPRTYRFDRNGELKDDQNGSGQDRR